MIDLPNLETVDFSSLSDQVFQHIKGLILKGELAGGQRIPEGQIAEAFGVSRTPIREALRKLEKHGLVEIIPRKFAKVIRLDIGDKPLIGQMRVHLDTLSMQLLSQRATDQDHQELTAIARQCSDYGTNGDFVRCFEKDSELHCEFARRSGNPYLFDTVHHLDLKVQLLRIIERDFDKKVILKGLEQHFLIVDAVCTHKTEEAISLVTRHLKEYYFSE